MSSKFDPQKHHRRSIRLKGYDYSQSGAYFVTIVTWQRECLFGEVVQGEMRKNRNGEVVKWETDGIDGSPLPRGPQPASLGAIIGQFKSRVTKRLWKFLSLNGRPIWQRNYYEHIIRNEQEMQNMWRYIESNPANWVEDDENPKNIQS